MKNQTCLLIALFGVFLLIQSCKKDEDKVDIAARGYLAGSNITADYSDYGDIPLNAENFDTGNIFDTNTGKFTIPSDGYYQVNATIYLITPSPGFIHLQIDKNTPANTVSAASATGGDGYDVQLSHSDLLYFETGDVVGLSLHFSGGTATVGALGSNNLAITYMSISKVN